MPLYRHDAEFAALPSETLDAWRAIPPAIASDCMNRAQAMGAQVKPLATGTRLAGQARTIACMAGDNMAIHAAMRLIRAGEVLVVAAGGHTGVALFGGLLAQSAQARGVAGLITDGAVRDVAEIREMGFACFAAGVTPAGPHKGFGGTIDGVISCGGCPVVPGDIVLGDDDGVAVVPLARAGHLLAECQAKIAQEEAALARLANDELLADQMGIPEPENLG
ncbi:MAG: hypothetical protein OEN23_08480 [Paracoccaceae bacterium]|nr:hypothetical protein [Paracoccaceae bacterium]